MDMSVISSATEHRIRRTFEQLEDSMDERMRRLWAASESLALGYGGLAAVSRATGIARSTIVPTALRQERRVSWNESYVDFSRGRS